MYKFFALLFALAFVGAAQNNRQAGSVAIAGNIRVDDDPALAKFTQCVASLTKEAGVPAKDAIGACKKISIEVAKTSVKIANEAADATKASRPVVIVPDYYNRGGYYGGYSSGYVYDSGSYYSPRVYTPRQPRQPRYHTLRCRQGPCGSSESKPEEKEEK